MQLHADARVRLVGAVGVHCIPVRQATQRQGHLHAHLGKRVGEHLLERTHDVILVDEAHLDVHLRELGLAVGAQVLVAEALCHLVVALHAAHHKQLLEQLRALGQGVEAARLGATGHQEVAGALGGRLEQRRGLHLHEGAVVQRLADGKGEVRAQLEVGHHGRTTDVEIAVAQAQVLAGLDMVLDLEGRRLGAVEDLDLGDENLDLTRGEVVVGLALDAMAHLALDQHGPLGTDRLGRGKGLCIAEVGVKEDLGQALAVAKVDEDEAAEVATTPHPTRKRDLLADVLCAQLSAGVGMQGEIAHVDVLSSCRCPVLVRAAPGRRRPSVDSARARKDALYYAR